MRTPRLLAVLPVALAAFGWSAPVRTYDLLDVDWSVKLFPEKRAIVGEVTNTIRPLADGLRTFEFHCAKLLVSEVRVNGARTPFVQAEPSLRITLPKPAGKKDALKVTIAYSGVPQGGVYFVAPEDAFPAKTWMVYTQGEMEDTRYWLPTYDYPNDKATSRGTIEVPAGWNVLSNGARKAVVPQANRTIYKWAIEQPHSTYLISFVAGPYSEIVEKWGDLPVSVYVPKGLETWGKASFGGTNDMVRFYSELTGFKYPYAKFAQALVADFPFGGMENISAVTNTIGALHPVEEKPLEDAMGLNLHELAHQWFGDTVTTPNWSHIWVNEGFASFLPNFYVRYKKGQDLYDLGRLGAFDGALAAHSGSNRPMVWTGYKEPIEMFDGFAYAGGAARMFMLMHKLGEKRFWAAIKAMFAERAFTNVNTEQVFASIEKATGEKLDTFRKQWFYRAAAPNLTVKRKGGRVILEQKEPAFDLEVDVWILNGGQWTKVYVPMTQATVTVEAPGATGPVLVDPEVWIMADVTYDFPISTADFDALYRHAPNAAQRLRLIRLMVERKDNDALAAAFKTEKTPELVAEIVRSVPVERTDLLLTALDNSDLRVRQAAVGSLGNSKDPAVAQRLKAMWLIKSAMPTGLRADLLGAVLNVTNDMALAKTSLEVDSFHDAIRGRAFSWLVQHDRQAGYDAAMRFAQNAPNYSIRVAALGALGGMKDLDASRAGLRLLMRTVQESPFQAQTTALRALQQYGDPIALAVVEPLMDHGMHFVRNSARGCVETLRAAAKN
ncbi:MAG: M1 family metallopeptidase [Fimbriimonadaceae bacterium]|nr:M1 family metallopeptidase [Fimbriimonadaceae bacterium]